VPPLRNRTAPSTGHRAAPLQGALRGLVPGRLRAHGSSDARKFAVSWCPPGTVRRIRRASYGGSSLYSITIPDYGDQDVAMELSRINVAACRASHPEREAFHARYRQATVGRPVSTRRRTLAHPVSGGHPAPRGLNRALNARPAARPPLTTRAI
jgi:hypothetical protein